MSRLAGKVVIVTGASSGIGEATAKLFAQEGAAVALVSDNRPELERVADDISRCGGTAQVFVSDFSRSDEVTGLVARIEAEMGALDVLVNNAGMGYGARILDTPIEAVRRLFEVNLLSAVQLSRDSLRLMKERRRGRIINVSSAAGQFGGAEIAAYAATKGAMHAFTQALRIEAGEWGVQVAEVVPISVRTEFFSNVGGEKYAPNGITLTAETVARSIVSGASSTRMRCEILPYRPLRLAIALNGLMPGLFVWLQVVQERNRRRAAPQVDSR